MLPDDVQEKVLCFAAAIVDREIEPFFGGARGIWAAVSEDSDPSDLPEHLVAFIGLASEFEDHEEHRGDYAADIIGQAETTLALYLDVQNTYNATNPEGSFYNYDFTERYQIPGLPIIPSLGLRGEL